MNRPVTCFPCACSTSNEPEKVRLQGDIGELITPGQDQVLILDLGDSETPLETALACLGRPYQPAVRVQIV